MQLFTTIHPVKKMGRVVKASEGFIKRGASKSF